MPRRRPGVIPLECGLARGDDASLWQKVAALRPRRCYPPGMADDKKSGMKSAYELALERMDSQGIERPRGEALGEEVKREMAEVRQRAEAKIAELEILHRDRLKRLADPTAREAEEEDYRRERRQIEADRESKLDALRAR
ncbi:MAG TPA: hypothetical protein VHQ65_10500 [Thermoanaerobaculia bacterium]|nr:hypothetical protein [Thermoanaerobaculia bacterium]